MLTIRHIEPGGYELVQQVERVWRGPRPEAGERDYHPLYAGLATEADPLVFDSGTVYVMNEAGNTVSVYRLEHADKA